MSEGQHHAQQQIGAGRLAAYAAPSMPLAMLLVPILTYLPSFYALERGLALKTVGLAFLLGRLIDGFADPIVGLLSDRARSRGGRRAAWLIGGTPFLMLATFALCTPPGQIGFLTLVLLLTLFYVASAVVQIPYAAWGADLSHEYTGRNRIGAFREAGFMLGMMLAVGLPSLLVKGDVAGMEPILSVFSISIVILLPVTAAIAVLFGREAAPGTSAERSISFRDMLRAIFLNRPLRLFVASFWLLDTGLSVFDATIALFFAGVLQMPNFLPLILLQYLCSLACLPLALRFGNRFGKHVGLCIFAFGYALALLMLSFAPPGATWIVYAAIILKGACVPLFRVMPASMMADLADYWQLQSGRSLTGVYMSLLQVTTKLGMAAGIGIAFPLLEALGFDTSAPADRNQHALLAVCCALPCVLLGASVLLFLRYPLTRRKYNIIQRRLARRADQQGG